MSDSKKKELIKENEALMRKVDELSATLYQVNQKLKESESLKSHFISNITNEIVNPFASVIANAENIQSLNENEMSQAWKMANMIFDEAFYLDFQLKNILAAAAIEAGTDGLKPVSVNLKSVAEGIVDFFKKQCEKKQVDVKLSWQTNDGVQNFDAFVTDEEKLSLLIKNLVDNAVKFSPQNGLVDINLWIENDSLFFQISDEGKGIPETEKQLIFDRFKQLDKRISSLNTGHGLGMSIVSAYLDQFDGQLHFEELVGTGTSITVTIPEMEKGTEWEDLN
ncbi:MAG TPA: HAMP domain-containing sensor histidine kinase, partial [Sunxiuqinia sp.]|nr:HAMP domain-containing sensor histidine kinase [Sunxiuqinia sp.]